MTETTESAAVDGDFTFRPTDGIGRSRIFFNTLTNSDDYLERCRFLDVHMRNGRGSRWSVRGLVADPLPAAEIGRRLGFATPVEVTTITAPAAGSGPAYLWVSRNRSERLPDQAAQDETLRRMHRLDGYQRAFTGRFRAETETLLDKAADAGLRVVCNAPPPVTGVPSASTPGPSHG